MARGGANGGRDVNFQPYCPFTHKYTVMKNSLAWRIAGLLAVLVLRASSGWAQAPTWTWAQTPGSGYGNSTAVDAAGNVYVIGSFYGTVTFDGTLLTSLGSQDVFIAKINSSGTYQWAVQAGSLDDDFGFGVAVDSSGSVYVTGSFSDSAAFGSMVLTSNGSRDLFVAKLTSAGNWQWAVGAGGTNSTAFYGDTGTALAVDDAGSVYVTGNYFGPEATFGSTTLLTAGSGIFIAKLTPAGVWEWAVSAGGSIDKAAGIAVDTNRNVYVTGGFTGTNAIFGSTTLTSSGIDMFLIKLNAVGGWEWVKSAGGPSIDEGRGVAVDSSGNVYVSGEFRSPSMSLGTRLTNSGAVDTRDVFVAKLNSAGLWKWAVRPNGSTEEWNNGLTVSPGGEVYLTGISGSPSIRIGSTTLVTRRGLMFVSKLTTNGAWRWAVQAGGIGAESVNSQAVDGSGSVYVTGFTQSPSPRFGTIILPSLGNTNVHIFFARLTPTITGLPEASTPSPLTLTPNPAHHAVRLTGATAPTAILLDALGRTVRTWPLEPATSDLDLAGLPAGLYTVRAGAATRRLVVE